MLPVPMTGHGPDMDAVEALAADPSVKGMWCVPKYSNPTGETYSDETVRRLAAMRTGAPDFRLFWDNAYAVHHLTRTRHQVANILDACVKAGNPDRAFIFGSTSKITLAGAGLAFFASSPANVAWYLARAFKRTIGSDKLNQLRHVRFLKDQAGLMRHMDGHRALLAPKFDAVNAALESRLAGTGAATWAKPGRRLLHQPGRNSRHRETGCGAGEGCRTGVDRGRFHLAARTGSARQQSPAGPNVSVVGGGHRCVGGHRAVHPARGDRKAVCRPDAIRIGHSGPRRRKPTIERCDQCRASR